MVAPVCGRTDAVSVRPYEVVRSCAGREEIGDAPDRSSGARGRAAECSRAADEQVILRALRSLDGCAHDRRHAADRGNFIVSITCIAVRVRMDPPA